MATTTERAPAGRQNGNGSGSPAWHTLQTDEALTSQGVTQSTGLSADEVERRRAQYGRNAFTHAEKEPGWQAFLRQYRDLMQLVLLGAALISLLVVRELGTALLLFGLTLLNAVLGLNQEGKAEESVAALQKMMIVQSRTRRGGKLELVPAEDLVPGDIVAIEAGDR